MPVLPRNAVLNPVWSALETPMRHNSLSVSLVALFAVLVPWSSAFAECILSECQARSTDCASYSCRYDSRIDDTRCVKTVSAPAGTPCDTYGACSARASCDGTGSCVQVPLPAGTLCRPAASGCDAPETCNGTASLCPTNQFMPDGTVCSDDNPCTAKEHCTAGVCTGGTPSIVLEPSPLTFPTTMQGAPAPNQTLRVRNVGIASQEVVSVTASSAEFPVVDYTAGVVAPNGGTASVTVGFTPAGIGTRSGTIDVTTNSCTFSGSVTGTGVAPELSVEPPGWDFGNLDINVVSPLGRDFVITNTGTIAEELTAIRVPQGGPFTMTLVSGTSLPKVLQVGDTFTFNVSAQPTELGEVVGEVTFSFMNTTHTTSIQVKVNGICSSCGADAGTDAGVPDTSEEVQPGGCGCHSADAAPLLALALGALAMLARRRRA